MIGIKSNVLNRIKKIREGKVYGSPVGFVAELIQNAQRAKAKHIWINVDETTFTIEDDGKGCSNPENVFTLDLSGWGDDVHSPFGEGFGSVFAVADYIEVMSRDWVAELDLKNCLETGDLEQIRLTQTPEKKGFKVRLTYSGIEKNDILTEANQIGNMIKPMMFVNGSLVDKAKISYSPFTYYKKTRMGEILATVSNSYEGIELFYEGRPVKKCYFSGIKGIMALASNALTLRTPDRKDIVNDEKYRAFQDRMENIKKEVLIHLLKNHPDSINNFKYELGHNLSPRDYYKQISYGLLTADDEKQKETEYYAADLGTECTRSVGMGTIRGTAPGKQLSAGTQPSNSEREIALIRKLVKKGQVFYLDNDDNNMDELVSKLEYYGIKVIRADVMQKKVMEYLNVPHVKDAIDNIVRTYDFKKIGPQTKKEKRILALLDEIMPALQLFKGLFTVANISSTVRIEILGKVRSKEKSSPNAVFSKNSDGYKIILNRKLFKGYPLNLTSKLGSAKDLKLLGRIAHSVAHELAHMLESTEDNTIRHYQVEVDIYNRLQKAINEVF